MEIKVDTESGTVALNISGTYTAQALQKPVVTSPPQAPPHRSSAGLPGGARWGPRRALP